jgi:hypothetical protein
MPSSTNLPDPAEWNTELVRYFSNYVPVLSTRTIVVVVSVRQQSLSRDLLFSQLLHQIEDEAVVGRWSPPQNSYTDDQDSRERYNSHAGHETPRA